MVCIFSFFVAYACAYPPVGLCTAGERAMPLKSRAFKNQKNICAVFGQIAWRLRGLPLKGAHIPG